MGYTVKQIADRMAMWADPKWAESYDNVGLLIGREAQEVTGVVTALDVTEEVIDYAVAMGAQMIVSHHPLMFRATRRITDGDRDGERILSIIEQKLAVCACHTNMDSAPGGTNDILAERIGLLNVSVLESLSADGTENAAADTGMGRIGYLPRAMRAEEFARHVCRVLDAPHVRLISREPDARILKVALVSGKGDSYIEEARRQGADAFVTGDITYHQAEEVYATGFTVIDAGHFATEQPIAEALAQYLQHEFPALSVYSWSLAQDPFRVIQ